MHALRTQMIQDLQIAGLGERTHEAYVRSMRKLAEHYPDRAHRARVGPRRDAPRRAGIEAEQGDLDPFTSPQLPRPKLRCAACGGPLVVIGFISPGDNLPRGPPLGRSAA